MSKNKSCADIVLYAVRNEKGEWFRKIGYGGYGNSWSEKFPIARIYSRIGPARAVISWWANHYPNYPAPQLVKLEVSKIVVINETERVEKQKQVKIKKELARKLRDEQRNLEYAQSKLREAQIRYYGLFSPNK